MSQDIYNTECIRHALTKMLTLAKTGTISLLGRADTGICHNMYLICKLEGYWTALDAWQDQWQDLMETWPPFSGCHAYPIPATDVRFVGSEIGEMDQYDMGNKWEGAQLGLRISLLEHCLEGLAL